MYLSSILLSMLLFFLSFSFFPAAAYTVTKNPVSLSEKFRSSFPRLRANFLESAEKHSDIDRSRIGSELPATRLISCWLKIKLMNCFLFFLLRKWTHRTIWSSNPRVETSRMSISDMSPLTALTVFKVCMQSALKML